MRIWPRRHCTSSRLVTLHAVHYSHTPTASNIELPPTMKIRIGVGLGAGSASVADAFTAAVQQMERCGFDSLWLSEVLTTGVIDPLAGLAFAAGVTRKLKLGTT